ncbi:MAG: dephospho-CoA kinase [Propionibacteriaceae bacterium]|jgi:dephospho-CoA kinase|nr:dephospho-CoA kinase [Propionibacteriaceae bacterium]
MRKLRVGLTGGIASGKSVVARFFEEFGAVVVDYDVLARRVVEPGTPGLEVLVQVFGKQILRRNGTLDREEFAELVFNDEQTRDQLNAIIHPLIHAAAIGADDAAPDGAIVMHIIPLLVETGFVAEFDKIVVVDVPIETQIERLMGRNGYNRMQAKQRIAAQAIRETRLAVADYVIDNSGTIAATLEQAQQVWSQLAASRASS